MWLYTTFGFFSIVHGRDANTDLLVVRSRVASDLARLRTTYLPELTPTTASADTDYQYRGTCTQAQLAAAMGKIALDIDYTNFKSEVAAVQGYERAHVYGDVWAVNLDMQRIDRQEQAIKRLTPRKRKQVKKANTIVKKNGGSWKADVK